MSPQNRFPMVACHRELSTVCARCGTILGAPEQVELAAQVRLKGFEPIDFRRQMDVNGAVPFFKLGLGLGLLVF